MKEVIILKNIEVKGVPVSIGQKVYYLNFGRSKPELDKVESASVEELSVNVRKNDTHCNILLIFNETDTCSVIHPHEICTCTEWEDVDEQTVAWCNYFTSKEIAEKVLKERKYVDTCKLIDKLLKKSGEVVIGRIKITQEGIQ